MHNEQSKIYTGDSNELCLLKTRRTTRKLKVSKKQGKWWKNGPNSQAEDKAIQA